MDRVGRQDAHKRQKRNHVSQEQRLARGRAGVEQKRERQQDGGFGRLLPKGEQSAAGCCQENGPAQSLRQRVPEVIDATDPQVQALVATRQVVQLEPEMAREQLPVEERVRAREHENPNSGPEEDPGAWRVQRLPSRHDQAQTTNLRSVSQRVCHHQHRGHDEANVLGGGSQTGEQSGDRVIPISAFLIGTEQRPDGQAQKERHGHIRDAEV